MKRRRGDIFAVCVIVLICAAIQLPWVSSNPSESPTSTTVALDNVPERGNIKLGDPCTETLQCATTGAVCQGTCQCGPDAPISNNEDKCDKEAKLNEACTFDQQCEKVNDMSKCEEGVCKCRYDMKPIIRQDGSLQCAAQGNAKLNEECTENKDCGTDGAFCDNTVCKCHKDLPATNNVNRCGKERSINQTCTFDEQCTQTEQTECKDGLCKCEKDLAPYFENGVVKCGKRGKAMFGDNCNSLLDCGFDYAICAGNGQKNTCQCPPDMQANNNLDKCGKAAKVNESCTFNEQCEAEVEMTECKENRCQCRFQMVAATDKDGITKCSSAKHVETKNTTHVDPAMIGVLVGMGLMFIILCVVLRLFSKARWRENRTIFNTPNPRLMNVSLLRDSKLLHGAGERRGSRASVRAPSRQPSMASLRPQSPSQSIGSRRSRRSSSPSVTSTKSPKSPIKPSANNISNNTGNPVLENVTVEIQDPKV